MYQVNFSDQYTGFTPDGSSLFRFLRDRFGAVISDSPDYLIAGPYGFNHLKYDCVKIFWTGESVVPDFNLFDYAIGFDHLSFGDRYLRVPLYPFRSDFVGFRAPESRPTDDQLLNRDFCSFVVSNGKGDPIRTEFFERLGRYKRVDSGGRYLNNIGGPVDDKRSFVARHKFSITFENASAPGYVTEKMMEAHAAWSVPIYWGDPEVESDFRPESFVWVKDRQSFDAAIDQIVELDRNDAAYLAMCTAEPLVHVDRDHYWKELERFFDRIFSQPLDCARRLMDYGCQAASYRPAVIQAFEDSRLMAKPRSWQKKVRYYRKRVAVKLGLRAK